MRARIRMQHWNQNQGILACHRTALTLLVASALFGCAGAVQGPGGKGMATERARTVEHEPCDYESKSAEKVDVDGNGAPDLIVVKDGAKELCRSADLDFDGRVDLWSYLDDSGRVRRRELDYDRDGNIDEIQLFKAGEIAEKHRASTPAKRLDTWEFYTGGRLVRAERDADGDGHVDQWWDYRTVDCPVIRSDTDGNGQPDPKSEVDYCKESGYKPPEQAAPTVAPMLQKDTAALPTETSNQPADPTGNPDASSAAKPSDTKSQAEKAASSGQAKDAAPKESGSKASGKGGGK